MVETPLEGLRLFRITTPVARLAAVSPTGICVIAQGFKRTYFGGQIHQYDSQRYLCCSLPLPVEAEVPQASPQHPVLGVLLDLDTPTIVEAISSSATLVKLGDDEPGLCLAPRNAAFDEALARLLELLDDEVARSALAESRLRELAFEIVRGKAGPSLCRALGPNREVARAISYLRSNLGEPISVDELAKRAGMSRGVFYRRFKAATAHSPIQFLKAVRLNRAAMLLSTGISVGDAANDVGYVSQSQFSREFRRYFGQTPREWSAARGTSPLWANPKPRPEPK